MVQTSALSFIVACCVVRVRCTCLCITHSLCAPVHTNLYTNLSVSVQLIPQISSLSWFTTIVPLALVLSITAVKDATDDYVSMFFMHHTLTQLCTWQDNITVKYSTRTPDYF